jgi:hypothetical protein
MIEFSVTIAVSLNMWQIGMTQVESDPQGGMVARGAAIWFGPVGLQVTIYSDSDD